MLRYVPLGLVPIIQMCVYMWVVVVACMRICLRGTKELLNRDHYSKRWCLRFHESQLTFLFHSPWKPTSMPTTHSDAKN